MMRTRAPAVVAALLACMSVIAPRDGAAQIAWDAPMLVAPETPAGWGFHLMDPDPGSGIGLMTTWRSGDGPGTGYRLGLGEGVGGDLAIFGGVDLSGTLVTAGTDFPLNVVWVTGVGLGARDSFLFTFPLGVSVGRAVQADDVWFNPSVSPRVMLDALLGGSDVDSQLDLRLAVDLGVDVAFDPNWAIRFGGTLGDRSALSIGLSLRVL